MKKIIFIILLVIGIGGWIIFNRLDLSRPIELETYEPSPECAPAYTALCQTEAPDSPDNTHAYDIERTVRILNSLEAAQSQSETFEEFLEYMARQDYRGVSPDVLAAKRKLFPILEEMNQLRHTSKELSSVWYCLKNASRKLIDEAQGSGSSSNYMLSLCSSGGAAAAATCIDRAFSSFCEQQDLKRKTENRLNRLRRQYIAYIEQYAPIYYKYMDEWNTLCLDKDRAYINLYAGKLSDALNASQKVLDRHPENREGLLLKALSLIRLGAQSLPEFVLPEDAACNQRWIVEGRANYEQRTLANPCYFTARRILDQYMELYPDKAAPALLLDGILEEQLGHDARAIALYEQAAIEYPRQAEALTDLLDAYTSRRSSGCIYQQDLSCTIRRGQLSAELLSFDNDRCRDFQSQFPQSGALRPARQHGSQPGGDLQTFFPTRQSGRAGLSAIRHAILRKLSLRQFQAHAARTILHRSEIQSGNEVHGHGQEKEPDCRIA